MFHVSPKKNRRKKNEGKDAIIVYKVSRCIKLEKKKPLNTRVPIHH